MVYQRSLFIFRRDLRVDDNIGLIKALQSSEGVVACFIFTPEQIQKNAYRSDHALQFMIESLEDLQDQLHKRGGKLYFFYGEPDVVVDRCIRDEKIDAVFVNRDYTPYSQKRDRKIQAVCRKHRIDFHSSDDALLHAPEDTLKDDGTPYLMFTPYFRHSLQLEVSKPKKTSQNQYFHGKISFDQPELLQKFLPKIETIFPGGRTHALKILKNIKEFSSYPKTRDFPSLPTTHLSAYLKFNVCSVREAYYAIVQSLGAHHELIRSLFWRDFFTSIAFFFPRVFQGAFHEKFNRIPWSYDKKAFRAWCEGKTGFPIVDAGMRELNETGFMHNRVRMITASFLVKDLHIDWRWGEKYFAEKLIDYDPAVNNGNWQWIASSGADSQPYFRIFNPWSQQKRFDPKFEYIKKWTSEPSAFSPMLDHQKESKKSISVYAKIK